MHLLSDDDEGTLPQHIPPENLAFYEHIYAKTNAIAEDWEAPYRQAALEQFEEDMRYSLAQVTEIKEKAYQTRASIDWQLLSVVLEKYYAGAAGEAWRKRFIPLLEGTMTDQAESLKIEYGFDFAVPNIGGMEWFNTYELKFAQDINQTTNKGLAELCQQANLEGWTIPEMEKHMQQMFHQWMYGDGTKDDFKWYEDRLPPYRIEMIARTETMRASNYGGYNVMQEWGIQQKEWVATGDKRTRKSHMDAWAAYSQGGTPGAIPMSQPFVVGGQNMMYPGDPAGGTEGINCRCTVIPSLNSAVTNKPPK